MSIADLLTESITIWHPTPDGEDSTGDPVYDWEAGDTVDAFTSRLESTEVIVGRDQVQVDRSWIVPAGTTVGAYDRVVQDGQTFEVVGAPLVAHQPDVGVHHVVVRGRFVDG